MPQTHFVKVTELLLLLLFVPVLSAIQGDSPITAITVTPGTTLFDSTLMPLTSDSTPQSCRISGGTVTGPFYRAIWFRYNPGKKVKIVEAKVGMFSTEQGYPVIAAFRENADRTLTAVARDPYGGDVVFGNQHDATYLVMVAIWSEAGGSSTLTITASEVGVLMKKSDADIIWFYWGEPDESGMLTASLNFPEPITPTCESVGQNPYRVHWTALRTDVIHQTWRGDFYTTVYRFPANDFDTWIQTLNVCEPLVGAIAVGTTHLSLHDNNVTVAGGKSDSFGEVIVGSLSDRTSLCPGKKANYLLSYEAMVPTDGDGTWVIRHGVTSRLTCGY